ncbi:hypothetical protein CLAFUW4_03468 [Fulvia fulva]|uniref:Uncharacterized protein n=1 Tax=Passalora fulva TaxID=5499 RepID=A0A9Q8LAV7_PASFU|nr:uncharacterized protein CLAFUR5_03447 [Fulvia fulva]KAK4632158.1 hypothetical protein CLAFUR4_03457 [Fulvia fulva]KAK4633774.1 hypothetical protein CLAFUR0_03462 [Fulvia fulva]UJO13990.1 hypothetical protein CLAFUR5_03447 [Fulvia fulva]WPV11555.1 hypothetical protein CLAFUW4_03468 [Fulvia fulva]WPV26709.1 hypothetical protein CLAFUW7_03460 [Fulvia fulva]
MNKPRRKHRLCCKSWSPVTESLSLQLLRVSRLIYNEAALVVFADNTWLIEASQGGFQRFMAKLMPCQLRAIKEIELYCRLRYSERGVLPRSGLTIGKNLASLRRLRVGVVLDHHYIQTREDKDLGKCLKPLADLAQGQLDVVKLSVSRVKGKVSKELHKRFQDLESFMRLSKAELEERRAKMKQDKAEEVAQARDEVREKEEAQAQAQARQQEARNASRDMARAKRGLRALKKS